MFGPQTVIMRSCFSQLHAAVVYMWKVLLFSDNSITQLTLNCSSVPCGGAMSAYSASDIVIAVLPACRTIVVAFFTIIVEDVIISSLPPCHKQIHLVQHVCDDFETAANTARRAAAAAGKAKTLNQPVFYCRTRRASDGLFSR
jgi:hypothetical protein